MAIKRAMRPWVSAGVIATSALAIHGCEFLTAVLPEVGFCDQIVPTMDLAKLGEGPALFVDAVRIIGQEVGAQSQSVGGGLSKGLDVSGSAMQAIGAYQYSGSGAYRREAAADRAFQLRFFYGDGVTGKTPGAPLEADLTKLESYLPPGGLPALLDPSAPKGPLFPLITTTGLTSGSLNFRDQALRFDVASLLKTNLKGYDMQLNLGTKRQSLGELVGQLAAGKVSLSLADTAMSNPAQQFTLAIKQFDMTYDVNGQAKLGGNYMFQVSHGPMKYLGAVTTTNGVPAVSLRCGESADTEFATISFANGSADFKYQAKNFPITLPGLAALKNP
ncbi:MAG: hypothetical protein ACK46X_08460 [Candidatus Sericytochromatia bacterium]